MVSCDFLKEKKKSIRAQSGSYAFADCKCGQVHDEILLVWLWALYSTTRVTHRGSCWPEVELSETDGLPRERDILEASPPLSAVFTARGFLRSSNFSERWWFFSCTWSSASEWCLVALRIRKRAGLLVKIHICESCTWRGRSREVSKVLRLAKGLFFSSEKPSGCF